MRATMKDPEVVHQRRWLTLVVLCVSLLVIGIDNTVLNVAIPTLAHPKSVGGLGATVSQLQWIVDAYTIIWAGLLLTAGSLGDRFGRYKGLTLGLGIFGFGSLASSFAPSAHFLIATRALMGVGGAFIMPSTLSILTNVFHNPRERAKAIGIWAGVAALGIGVGPVIGGFLLSHFWWGSVFLINVPVVTAGLVGGFFFVPESKDPAAPKLDPVGALLSIAGLTSLLWAVIEVPTNGWSSPGIIAGFVAGLGLMAGFMVWELRSSHPMLDIRIFENPRFSAASGAIMLTFLALFGTVFLLTQYLQSVLGFSTLKAGATLLPMSAVMMVAAPSSASLAHRFGTKRVVSTGLLFVTLALALYGVLPVHGTLLEVIGVGMVLGLGMGNVMAPATESIMGSLPRAKAGVGSAVNDTTRQVGGAVGVAVLGSIMSSRYMSHVGHLLQGNVPADVYSSVRDNIGKAVGVGAQLRAQGSPYATRVIDATKSSFVSAMHVSAFAAAGVTLIAAVAVLLWLPARAPDEQDVIDPGAVAAGRAPELADLEVVNGADVPSAVEIG